MYTKAAYSRNGLMNWVALTQESTTAHSLADPRHSHWRTSSTAADKEMAHKRGVAIDCVLLWSFSGLILFVADYCFGPPVLVVQLAQCLLLILASSLGSIDAMDNISHQKARRFKGAAQD